MTKFSAAVACFLLACAGSAIAKQTGQAEATLPYHPTENEIKALPAYCAAKFAGAGPEHEHWKSILGPGFMDVHHYCVGLNYIGRYYRSRNSQNKSFYLQNAINDFDYMIGANKPGFSLMWEIYLNRGLAYSLMKQHGKAVADMNRAIELNPRQIKAYNVLADYYSGANQKSKALETVTEGLRHNPGTKSLQRRYVELGGKLPYPEPIQTTPVETAQSVAIPDKQIEPPSESDKTMNGTPASAPAVAPGEPASPPKIGTPKNPYCRFCTE